VLGGLREPFVGLRSRRIGGQWRENEVLPERHWSGRTVS
jgi:hypothetical protein